LGIQSSLGKLPAHGLGATRHIDCFRHQFQQLANTGDDRESGPVDRDSGSSGDVHFPTAWRMILLLDVWQFFCESL
jgi:hypothetical protein